MIKRIEISGVHYDVSDDLKKYTRRKIGKLDRYLPRAARQSAHLEIKFQESKKKDKKHCACEVTLHLPNETINVHEATVNMFAAVDIIEAKLKNQIKRYKDKHAPARHRAIIRKVASALKQGN